MPWNTNTPPNSNTDTSPFKDAERGERLQRILAKGGIGSRRKCEKLITDGKVKVNGVKVDFMPAWVNAKTDRIAVEGHKLNLHAEPIYVMYYKPRGILCTMNDPEGRPCVGEIVEHHTGNRIFPVGRLDLESQGLLILTNDNFLANQLTHPSHKISKIYEVTVRGTLAEETILKLKKGIYISDAHTRHDAKRAGKRAKLDSIKIKKQARDRTLLQIELSEGRNRQIRRMLEKVGHPVKRLRRTQIGPIKLSGLRVGYWRDLMPQEIANLQKAVRHP